MKHRSKLSWIVIMVLVFSTLFGGIAAAETYTVKKGDTLWTIAKTNGTTVAEMQKLNRLKNVNVLQVGQKLKLPEKPSTGSEVPQKKRKPDPLQSPFWAPLTCTEICGAILMKIVRKQRITGSHGYLHMSMK
ncbi:LysM peptidoglycan-binding domain-containing protein [Paenibacillus sp. CC-CFT742]|nr:LysM peptidoglycan-binding domain-containing protein [Paenibacillus sp. CC-CFT742]WJH29621.1 LysM peptidoglycan-binding domain-containing protein [Paenibacillus sp. CC-CFT742]